MHIATALCVSCAIDLQEAAASGKLFRDQLAVGRKGRIYEPACAHPSVRLLATTIIAQNLLYLGLAPAISGGGMTLGEFISLSRRDLRGGLRRVGRFSAGAAL